ncbi:helix-turn-helix domain-containing protein [Flavilitoribacter nigricans]|uniref:HTH araC/xylS-type domain-containing protein n=1 Tax=Flavilitoribacter nigricans (strain ATCC 23147 / DSM 23189 / NBRC 102662 / NCIMB 1420 / SS-2) TaxID=1122177 RepID=A0A2D0N2F7_FLAN2|nr:helix-turn-helix domain-containing protein [Flavilitoribacter nigricans]PHN01913.1 hypothetical protein CRP01_34540 [Flavilitoribacter nigricans DSM 23189 = NBRC 102662]
MNKAIEPSKLKIRNYVVYGEAGEMLSPAFVHCHQMEVTGKSHNWHIKPHIHSNLFQIFLMENGKTFFIGEHVRVELNKPSILTMPENTVHEFRQEREARGTVISISYALMEELLEHYPKGLTDLEKMQLFQQTDNRADFEQIFSLGRAVDEELRKDELGQQVTIRGLLGMLLIRILRLKQQEHPAQLPATHDLNYIHFKAFQNCIKQTNSSRKQIREYALELQMTPIHLNRICQSVAGKSALQVVRDHLILEAKRHLSYSSYSIAEIAHLLDFKEPNYFSRFFKKATGMSPKDFRKKKNKK